MNKKEFADRLKVAEYKPQPFFKNIRAKAQ